MPPRLVTCGVPQGSVLSAILFVKRTRVVHGLQPQLLHEGHAALLFCDPSQAAELKERMQLCMYEEWMPSNCL